MAFDPVSGNGQLHYRDGNGHPHEVQFLDAVSAANLWRWARPLGLQGAALWALGEEDPALWSFFGRHRLDRPPDFAALEKIDAPQGVETSGQGDLMRVVAEPRPGWRSIKANPEGDRIVAVNYRQLPCEYGVRRYGYQPRAVALTFDDGPDPLYTPLVLDQLKKYGVPATFFRPRSQCSSLS